MAVDTGMVDEVFALDPVDAVTITTLMDNVADLTLPDEGPAHRPPLSTSQKVDVSTFQGGQASDMLRAEHGFSALVTVSSGGASTRILFDAGITPFGMTENMRRLEVSPKDIDVIVLSHGHWDHTAGMHGLVKALGRTRLPVIIHPHFWHRRRLVFPGADPMEIPTTSRRALEDAGFEITEERDPSFILGRSVLVAIGLGVLFRDEQISTRALVGAGLVVLGAWIASRQES